MAEFYGRLQGSRGEATRCGTKDSGITATAESWKSVLRVAHHEFPHGNREAWFMVETKNGNRLLAPIVFDADALARHYDDSEVAWCARKVELAFADLARAIKSAPSREIEDAA